MVKIHEFNLIEYLQLSRGTEEFIYKVIAGIAMMLAIGTMIGVWSYIKRCIEDEDFS